MTFSLAEPRKKKTFLLAALFLFFAQQNEKSIFNPKWLQQKSDRDINASDLCVDMTQSESFNSGVDFFFLIFFSFALGAIEVRDWRHTKPNCKALDSMLVSSFAV
jgi:hypothetical protein